MTRQQSKRQWGRLVLTILFKTLLLGTVVYGWSGYLPFIWDSVPGSYRIAVLYSQFGIWVEIYLLFALFVSLLAFAIAFFIAIIAKV